MKTFLYLLLLFPAFGYSQLSRFNFYEPAKKDSTFKVDTAKRNLPFTALNGYLDTGIIMWSADTIHWIPSKGMVLGKEISGYYFDPGSSSYIKK